MKNLTKDKLRKSNDETERINGVNRRLTQLIIEICSYYDPNDRNKFIMGVGDYQMIKLIDKAMSQIDKYVDKIERHGETNKEFFFKSKKNVQIKEDNKPQNVYFKDQIDNTELPFIPKIIQKQCSQIPLNRNIEEARQNPQLFFKYIGNLEDFQFDHPYQKEIQKLEYPNFNEIVKFLQQHEVERVMSNNFQFIETEDQLNFMISHLQTQTMITVDLEHHSLRSYQGFTCLIQISTLDMDYIVDAILLRNLLEKLNIIFCNPQILKIFHGADQDIVWLQKDFGIYVVNLIDTYQIACKIRSNNSYGQLLQTYQGIVTDKTYQKADWRLRPIIPEMIKYARIDTHYLFGVLKGLLNELEQFCKTGGYDQSGYFKEIYDNCKRVSQKVYKKPKTYGDLYSRIVEKQQNCFDDQQMEMLEKLWKWRNDLARKMDESEPYILKTSILLKTIAEREEYKNYLDLEFQRGKIEEDIYQKLKDFLRAEFSQEYDHKEQETSAPMIEDDFQMKRLKENNLSQRIKSVQLFKLDNIFKLDFSFSIEKFEEGIYKLQEQTNQQQFNILDFIDYSKLDISKETAVPEEKQNEIVEQISENEEEMNFEDVPVEADPINGVELMKNLSSLNISQSMKQSLIEKMNKHSEKVIRQEPRKVEESKKFEDDMQKMEEKIRNKGSEYQKKDIFNEKRYKSKKKLSKKKGKKDF